MSPAGPRAELYQAGLLVAVAPTGSLSPPSPPRSFSPCAESKSGRLNAAVASGYEQKRLVITGVGGAVMEGSDGKWRCHFTLFNPPQPLGMDRGLMLPSETKLKDLFPAPQLFCAPLPRRWVPFTTIRWKCDTVRENFHLGLHRGVEVCVTYF